MAVIFVVIVVLVAWRFFGSSASRFEREFAALIDSPATTGGLAAFFSRTSSVSGTYRGRAVQLLVTRPARHSPGVVTLSMQTNAPPGSPWKDSGLTTRHADISRATFDLEGRYEVVLKREGQWLCADWTPRAGVLFPGAFDEARWRNTLAQMQIVVDWLEAGRGPVSEAHRAG
jgi:hypothetical protein